MPQLHQLSWKELFEPAINFAQKGVNIHERVAFDWAKNKQKLSFDPDTSKLFLKNGNAFEFMDNFKNENLSNTFKTIADEGSSGFYNGWVADDLIKKLNSIGGYQTV